MEGNITTWLSELAFAPVDLHPEAPPDEWSRDPGVGAQYFSQQAVGRLLPASGIEYDKGLTLPEQLKIVQKLMEEGDERALKIYDAIGIYLGYSLAHYAEFYDFEYVLLLGRVTSGPGGEHIIKPRFVGDDLGKRLHGKKMVGTARFELATSCSQSRRATRLRYAP